MAVYNFMPNTSSSNPTFYWKMSLDFLTYPIPAIASDILLTNDIQDGTITHFSGTNFDVFSFAVASNAVITHGTNSITLTGVSASSLIANNLYLTIQ